MRRLKSFPLLILVLSTLGACSKHHIGVITYDDTPYPAKWGGAFVAGVYNRSGLRTLRYSKIVSSAPGKMNWIVDDGNVEFLWIADGSLIEQGNGSAKAEIRCDSVRVFRRSDGIRNIEKEIYRKEKGGFVKNLAPSDISSAMEQFLNTSSVLSLVPPAIRECTGESIVGTRTVENDSHMHFRFNTSGTTFDFLRVPADSVPPL